MYCLHIPSWSALSSNAGIMFHSPHPPATLPTHRLRFAFSHAFIAVPNACMPLTQSVDLCGCVIYMLCHECVCRFVVHSFYSFYQGASQNKALCLQQQHQLQQQRQKHTQFHTNTEFSLNPR